MPPRRKAKINKYIDYDLERNQSQCLFDDCGMTLSGRRPANIKRHYKMRHKIDLDVDENGDCSENKSISPKSKKQKVSHNISVDNTKNTHDDELEIETHSDEELIQIKIEDTCTVSNETYDSITMGRKDFIQSCVGLVAFTNIPIQVFDENEYFKKLIKPYEKKFAININSQNINLMIGKVNQEVKEILTKQIDKIMICLKLELVSKVENAFSRTRNILIVSIQYVKDFKICTNIIGMFKMIYHTVDPVAEEIYKCIKDLSIDKVQLYTNTTIDNDWSMLPTMKQLLNEIKIYIYFMEKEIQEIKSKIADSFWFLPVIPCPARTLQLAANEVIKTLRSEIDECTQIVNKISTYKQTLDDDMKSWKSIFSMINFILVLRESKKYLDEHIGIDIDWKIIEDFVGAFKPLIDWELEMHSGQYIFGDFYRDWLCCELKLLEIAVKNPYASKLLSALKNQQKPLYECDVFIAALFLDPRFNFDASPLLSKKQRQVAQDHLMKTFESIQKMETHLIPQEKGEPNSIPTVDDFSKKSNGKYDNLGKHVQKMISITQAHQSVPKRDLKQKLSALCERNMEPMDTNVLEYWKKYYRHDSELSKLAAVVFAVPVTLGFSDSLTESELQKFLKDTDLYHFNSNELEACNFDSAEIDDILSS
ncbi:uncharacterized protein LOC129907607 [Episyrphus balteatus]|uniref:uncharacterized protein LOC129907607 n=1 Tax=Episyrphus balteatus TaxID=286459 RepID=UPI002485771A|nr:uncharacterized protein LOC129907607 [Episyrphus balteatus]